jgi:protein MpaA
MTLLPAEETLIGRSVERREIKAIRYGRGRHVRLILGGVHGDEPKSVRLARRLCEELSASGCLPATVSVVVVPVVNPDGYLVRRRRNANRVDLNRNFPTPDWSPGPRRSRFYGGSAPSSEPETRALISLIESLRPADIIAIHSISESRHCNNYNGPTEAATRLARAMAKGNGYPVTGDIGYATPGSFGSWAGGILGLPTITLELPSHHSPRRCWEENREALLAGLAGPD